MAITTVRLRVVGVFYDEILKIPGAGAKTVKDVLDFAVAAAQGTFIYTAETRFDKAKGKVIHSLKAFEHVLDDPLKPSLGNRQRAPGRYVLGETVENIGGSSIVHAWQYYVLDMAGKAISNAVEGKGRYEVSAAAPAVPLDPMDPIAKPGFTPFDQQKVPDGAEVIWRNVSIVRTPAAPF